MRYAWLFFLVMSTALNLTSPQSVSASGTLLEVQGNDCYQFVLQKATFSPVPFTYAMTGTCDLVQTRLKIPTKVPYTATGTYDPRNGKATEDINVPAPTIQEPSRPYGRFFASMHCNADPWQDRNVKCDQVVASVNPPGTAYPPNAQGRYWRSMVDSIVDVIKGSGRPYTSSVNDAQAKAFKAQYESYLAAEQKAKQFRDAFATVAPTKPSPEKYLIVIKPAVLAPAFGQRFAAQTPVPIKLAPPKGWNVTGYMVNIQRKDAKGNWVAHATIPVSAAEAQSAAGYTKFGAGAPPAYLAVAGSWRLNAQASSPTKSEVSEWVEFIATPFFEQSSGGKSSTFKNPFGK